jgi:hypothetical protein
MLFDYTILIEQFLANPFTYLTRKKVRKIERWKKDARKKVGQQK